jgi:hypothetical protein
MWVSVCFTDLSELNRRVRNGGDYKLRSGARSVYSSGCESVSVGE